MSHFHARWASRDRVCALRRAGLLRDRVLIDSMRGFIVVEPEDDPQADGRALTNAEADFELSPPWCREAHSTVRDARRRLGLEEIDVRPRAEV